jgi:hypothetical protein
MRPAIVEVRLARFGAGRKARKAISPIGRLRDRGHRNVVQANCEVPVAPLPFTVIEVSCMSYVAHVLQPGENILRVASLHWIGYWRSIGCFALAAATFLLHPTGWIAKDFIWMIAAGLVVVGLILGAATAFDRWTLEIGVTNKRVILKKGFISRETIEMNMDKVETVLVEQSLLGRILGYGAITVKGTGQSIEKLKNIADPIGLRAAITAR